MTAEVNKDKLQVLSEDLQVWKVVVQADGPLPDLHRNRIYRLEKGSMDLMRYTPLDFYETLSSVGMTQRATLYWIIELFGPESKAILARTQAIRNGIRAAWEGLSPRAFGWALRIRRKSLGKTLKELAQESAFSESRLSRIEIGKGNLSEDERREIFRTYRIYDPWPDIVSALEEARLGTGRSWSQIEEDLGKKFRHTFYNWKEGAQAKSLTPAKLVSIGKAFGLPTSRIRSVLKSLFNPEELRAYQVLRTAPEILAWPSVAPSVPPRALGWFLRDKREEMGCSLEDLSSQSRKAVSSFSDLETARFIPQDWETLANYLSFYGIYVMRPEEFEQWKFEPDREELSELYLKKLYLKILPVLEESEADPTLLALQDEWRNYPLYSFPPKDLTLGLFQGYLEAYGIPVWILG